MSNWKDNVMYDAFDIVQYDDNVYICIKPNIGETPNESSEYWSIGKTPSATGKDSIFFGVWGETTIDEIVDAIRKEKLIIIKKDNNSTSVSEGYDYYIATSYFYKRDLTGSITIELTNNIGGKASAAKILANVANNTLNWMQLPSMIYNVATAVTSGTQNNNYYPTVKCMVDYVTKAIADALK